MKLRNLAFLALVAAGFALSGCNTANDTTAQKKSTFFGLYTYEPGSYVPTSETAMNVRTEEVSGMELPSGDRTTFLWGLISVEDY